MNLNDLLITYSRIKTCRVCGAKFPMKKTGVCIRRSLFGTDAYWDYMNCPSCRCQILLQKRLKDVEAEHEG